MAGVLAALYEFPGRKLFLALAILPLLMPAFLWAILLIYLFAVELRLLPATGYVPFTEDPAGNLRCFVLPALTLALAEWPGIMRVLRSDMIAALQEDYIALAKAKGLKPSRILFVHALKPSSLTLVTITGINICFGVIIAITMAMLGMPNPLLWGAAATALNFIPYVGAAIGTATALIVGLITYGTIGPALVFLGTEAYWAKAIQGAIILMAVAFDAFHPRRGSHGHGRATQVA